MKKLKRTNIYIDTWWLKHFAVYLKLIQYCKSTVPQLKKQASKRSHWLIKISCWDQRWVDAGEVGLETTTRGRLFLLGHQTLVRVIEEPLPAASGFQQSWLFDFLSSSTRSCSWSFIVSSPASPFILPPVTSLVQNKWFLMGGGLGGEWIHVYVWPSPFTVHLKLSQYC